MASSPSLQPINLVDKIDLFPKLYYAIPIVRAQEYQFESKKLTVNEPMDPILWLIDAMALEGKDGYALRTLVESLVIQWYGPRVKTQFQRLCKTLENEGCIQQKPYENYKVCNCVRLTSKGKKILKGVKESRVKDLGFVYKAVQTFPIRQQKIIGAWLDHLGEQAWKKVIERIENDIRQYITNEHLLNRIIQDGWLTYQNNKKAENNFTI